MLLQGKVFLFAAQSTLILFAYEALLKFLNKYRALWDIWILKNATRNNVYLSES